MGIGTRDESTQLFIFSESVDKGHWYHDQDGLLYIIPASDDEESLGPDNETMTALNAVYRESDFEKVDPNELAAKMNLDYIPEVLHRFDEESGYYSA